MENDHRRNIIDEHFWFTATIVGLNGFSIATESFKITLLVLVIICGLNIFALHLILDRSSSYARGNGFPQNDKPEMVYERKYSKILADRAKLSWWELKQSIKLIPFIIVEVGSSLFYLLLVIFSFLAVCHKFMQAYCS